MSTGVSVTSSKNGTGNGLLRGSCPRRPRGRNPPTDVDAPDLPDPDDQKFVTCALAAGASAVVSGDAELVGLGFWEGLEILSPREFMDEFLTGPGT